MIRQITLFAAVSLRDFPQGRYLFVLIVPTTWLLVAGWQAWRRPADGSEDRATASPTARWAGIGLAAIGVIGLVFFDLYALLRALSGPYYYGRF